MSITTDKNILAEHFWGGRTTPWLFGWFGYPHLAKGKPPIVPIYIKFSNAKNHIFILQLFHNTDVAITINL